MTRSTGPGLISTSLWNGLAVSIRLGTALLLNKLLALFVGPAGYAVIGQFQNLVSMVVVFSTGAIGTGVTKYTAEYHQDAARQIALWRTAAAITLSASLVIAVALVLFRVPLAVRLLGNGDFATVFFWLAGSVVLISFNALLLSILNGKKEVRRFVVSNIAGSLIGLAVTGLLTKGFGLYGVLVALSINQAIVFVVTLQQTVSADWFRIESIIGKVDRVQLRNLSGFMLMAAVTAITGPTAQILVRNHLIAEFGLGYAGSWDAMWRISTLYLTLVTTTLSLYYLPRIAEIVDGGELRAEIMSSARLVVPAVAAVSLILFLARDQIVLLLFTSDFSPMRELFAWQLCGDVLKIAGWMIAFVMLGRSMTRLFIATEIAFNATFWLLTVSLTELYGFTGVAMAHFANYSLYLVAMFILVYRRL